MRDAIRSGWKTSSWSSFSPDRGELDRLAGDRLDRERGAAARVAVELRQDDAVERDPLLEGPRDGDGLLARHRVEDEQHVQRLHRVAHVRELVHQRLVDLEPAGGVDDHDVAAVGGRALEPLARGDDRVRRLGAVDGQLELPAELLELVDRRGALQVGGDEAGLLLLVLAQVERELCRRSRLAGALEAAEEDDGRRPAEREPRVGRAHQLGQLLVHDLDDLLARLEALQHLLPERPFPHGRHELLDHLEVDVRLEQREADLARRACDRLLVESRAPSEVAEGVLEAVGESVEHGPKRTRAVRRRVSRAGRGARGASSPS